MLRKNRRRLCWLLACFLLLSGMYVTFEKADSMVNHAVSTEIARIQQPDKASTSVVAYMVERPHSVLRSVADRIVQRNTLSRKDLRLPTLLLYMLCVAFFVLKCWTVEEILYVHEKKYRKALIKYIHDIDGKKRVSCLT